MIISNCHNEISLRFILYGEISTIMSRKTEFCSINNPISFNFI